MFLKAASSFLLSLLLTQSVVGCCAQAPPSEHRIAMLGKNRGVQIKSDDVDGGLSPIDDLTSVLIRDRHSRFFRVSWNFEGGSTSMAMTALYDRQKKTLRLYSAGGMYSTNSFAQLSPKNSLYTGVTYDILHRLAAKYPIRRGDDPYSFLGQLTSFGCGEHILK